MENTIKSMGITPSEHVYELEIDGVSLIFTDRGRFGEFEEGLDAVEYVDECALKSTGRSGCVLQERDSFAAGIYGEEIMHTIDRYRDDLVGGLLDMATWHVGSDATPRQRMLYWESIEKRYCRECGCEAPGAEGGEVVDFDFTTGEGNTDWVFFKTPKGVEVDILRLGVDLDITEWDGSMAGCRERGPDISGAELFLGLVDDIFFGGNGGLGFGDA